MAAAAPGYSLFTELHAGAEKALGMGMGGIGYSIFHLGRKPFPESLCISLVTFVSYTAKGGNNGLE